MANELKALSVAALGALLLSGCGREEPAPAPAPADPYDTPYARMHDPEYLKAIGAKRDEQKAIMREILAAKKAIADFRASHAGEAVPKALEEGLNAACGRMEANRKASQELVRERLQRENRAIRASQRNLKKGE